MTGTEVWTDEGRGTVIGSSYGPPLDDYRTLKIELADGRVIWRFENVVQCLTFGRPYR